MQSLVGRDDFGEDYDWLFVHAFRICLGKWVSNAEKRQKDESALEALDEDEQERAAAASILASCALNLMSDDSKDVDKAMEVLAEVETKPPITEDRIPFFVFFGSEIAGEMQCTLYRLPYLPLPGTYHRPCRPLLT
jgi:hypothetical protein